MFTSKVGDGERVRLKMKCSRLLTPVNSLTDQLGHCVVVHASQLNSQNASN